MTSAGFPTTVLIGLQLSRIIKSRIDSVTAPFDSSNLTQVKNNNEKSSSLLVPLPSKIINEESGAAARNH